MTQLFHPELVNDPFGDPGLYVDLQHRNHALLFDLGDISGLPARKLARLGHVFVSHTHVDHFCGFDRLLQVLLGQPKRISITGPAGFIGNVASRLGSYTWNLGGEDSVDAAIQAWEYGEDGALHSALFRFRNAFRREDLPARKIADGVIVDEPGYRVTAVHLDHHIPCLGFALEEKHRLNVWRTRVEQMGLGVGPWLDDLKQAILDDLPGDTPIAVHWQQHGKSCETVHSLGKLRSLVEITGGQKIAYVTDAGFTPDNVAKIIRLAKASDDLFIESAFLEAEAGLALRKMHLTARQAGEIARRAGVRRFQLFHFSPRYDGQPVRLVAEAADAAGLRPPGTAEPGQEG